MKNYLISELLNPQGLLVCSVCGNEFKPNDETKYIINGGYTCSGKCFITESKRRNEEKVAAEKQKANKK